MLKKGKCVNIGKPCSKALKKEILEADSLNFICPECGQPLVEVVGAEANKDMKGTNEPKVLRGAGGSKSRKTFLQKYGIWIGCVVVMLAITGGAVAFLGGDVEPPIPNVEKIDLVDQVSLTKGEIKQLTMTVEPVSAKGRYVWKSSNEQVATVDSQGQVTAVGKGKAQITVTLADNEAVSDVCECEVAKPDKDGSDQNLPLNNHGKVDLGYGIYVGDLKNGKPHGHGIITYKTAHKIVDSKDFVAQPGDEFEGDFRNGRISSLGYWKHNGNQTAVKP